MLTVNYEYKHKKCRRELIEAVNRLEWLERGLKEIKNIAKDLGIQMLAQSILDGESTTADEYNLEYKENMSNVVRISDINKEIAKEWKNNKKLKDPNYPNPFNREEEE